MAYTKTWPVGQAYNINQNKNIKRRIYNCNPKSLSAHYIKKKSSVKHPFTSKENQS